MVAGSPTREKLPMFLIGKSKRPHCSDNVNSLPSHKHHKRKAGLIVKYLKTGSVILIESFAQKVVGSGHWQLSCTSSYI